MKKDNKNKNAALVTARMPLIVPAIVGAVVLGLCVVAGVAVPKGRDQK